MSSMMQMMQVAESYLGCVPVIIADMDTGEIVYASQPAEALFGYNVLGELSAGAEGGQGHNIDELVPLPLRAAHAGHRARYAQEPYTRSMTRDEPLQGRKKDGTLIDVWIGLSAAVLSGRRCVMATIFATGGKRAAHARAPEV